MQKIHHDIYQVFYGYIALYDTEDCNSYPIFENNEQKDIIFSSKGVAVTTTSDEDIEVIIYRSKTKPKEPYYISSEIEIGDRGLTIGNEAIGDKENQVACNSGKMTISVCTDISTEETMTIAFVISEDKNNLL